MSVGPGITQPRMRECPGCGQHQTVPALTPGMIAQCVRCSTTLRRTVVHGLDQSTALVLAAFVLLVVMSTTTMMSVRTSGMQHSAFLLSGPTELVRRNMAPLALVVVFVTLLAPIARLTGTLYVLIRLRETKPVSHLKTVFAIAERLRPWSMIDVFVFGVFVAYVKLGDLVHITLDMGVYALLALTCVLIWMDGSLDREAVWDRLSEPDRTMVGASDTGLSGQTGIACDLCGLLSASRSDDLHCLRCGARLNHRKPNSLTRTWALLIAAGVLYIPANYYPVLTVVYLGAGSPSTILGGVEELLASHLYPLAVLVFFASILIPLLKMLGLAAMLVAVQSGRAEWLRDRTRLYHIIREIGRWSMIDIFMESLLGALVRFGTVITIQPGIGAMAFCAVVILTMFAAEAFDPRLMWDAATRATSPATRPAWQAD